MLGITNMGYVMPAAIVAYTPPRPVVKWTYFLEFIKLIVTS